MGKKSFFGHAALWALCLAAAACYPGYRLAQNYIAGRMEAQLRTETESILQALHTAILQKSVLLRKAARDAEEYWAVGDLPGCRALPPRYVTSYDAATGLGLSLSGLRWGRDVMGWDVMGQEEPGFAPVDAVPKTIADRSSDGHGGLSRMYGRSEAGGDCRFGHEYLRAPEARHGTGSSPFPDGGRPGRVGHHTGKFPARRPDAAYGTKHIFRSGKGNKDRPLGA